MSETATCIIIEILNSIIDEQIDFFNRIYPNFKSMTHKEISEFSKLFYLGSLALLAVLLKTLNKKLSRNFYYIPTDKAKLLKRSCKLARSPPINSLPI